MHLSSSETTSRFGCDGYLYPGHGHNCNQQYVPAVNRGAPSVLFILPFATNLDRAQQPLPVCANRHQKRLFKLSSNVKNGIRVLKEERIPQGIYGDEIASATL